MKKLVAIVLSLFSLSSFAEQALKLDLNLYINGELIKSDVIQTVSGMNQSITAEEVLKFDVTTTLNNGLVSLTSKMYKFEDGKYVKFQEPILNFELNEPATIEVGQQGIKVYKITIVANEI